MRSLIAAVFLAAPAASGVSLQPGFDLAVYDMVPRHHPDDFVLSTSPAVGFDLTLTIGQRVMFGVGYVAPTSDSKVPENKLFAARVDVLLLEGPVRPYVGAGYGYLWQHLAFIFDDGTSASGEGGAGVFEAGVMLVRWPSPGTLNFCVQYVIPTFSITNPSPFSADQVTAPFFLFGLKVGL